MEFYKSVLLGGAAALVAFGAAPARAAGGPESIDLSKATITLSAPKTPVLEKAALMLREEIQKRTNVALQQSDALPKEGAPAIALGVQSAVPKEWAAPPAGLAVPDKAEGYAIWVDTAARKAPTVYLVGHDERGALFAVGRLLRLLELRPGKIALAPNTRLATAPRERIRGHQIGYRDTNNTTDAWTVEQHEQYFRDMIVFGINAIELIPDFDEKPKGSVHMIMTSEEMNAKLSDIIASYGLDVWIWHALKGNVADAEKAKSELARSIEVFKKLPHLDAVFLPGGDPGDTAPKDLLPFLAQLVEELHKIHPKAEFWLSNQGFENDQNDYLFNYLEKEKPAWLTGMIYGPWAKHTMKVMRERTPKQYRVRSYPDLTHNVRCQYPVPHWDRAFALTLGRESSNPRPVAMAHIHNAECPYSEGFISYSDGVHDDVNKTIWSACAWDPDVKVEDVVRDYGRYYIGEDVGAAVGKGLLAQEKNWEGPLKNNATVDATLKLWQDIEKKAAPAVKTNWRLQQALMRAYYDEYVKQRLAIESEREAKAYAELKKAKTVGPQAALTAAHKALYPLKAKPEAPALRKRIEELGAALFKSIGAQLSVEKPFLASGSERGAVLDFLDAALNDAPWLDMRIKAIGNEVDSSKQLPQIEALVNWEDPGPGGFYDDLGNATKEPHLVAGKPWADDPGFVSSPQDEFSGSPNLAPDKLLGDPAAEKPKSAVRLSWLDTAQTLFDTPLRVHYDKLDPNATYKVRITYAGRFKATMKLTANDKFEIEKPGPVEKPETAKLMTASDPIAPQEYPIPKEATKGGTLDLRWDKVEGRGCQVAEIWLLKQ